MHFVVPFWGQFGVWQIDDNYSFTGPEGLLYEKDVTHLRSLADLSKLVQPLNENMSILQAFDQILWKPFFIGPSLYRTDGLKDDRAFVVDKKSRCSGIDFFLHIILVRFEILQKAFCSYSKSFLFFIWERGLIQIRYDKNLVRFWLSLKRVYRF